MTNDEAFREWGRAFRDQLAAYTPPGTGWFTLHIPFRRQPKCRASLRAMRRRRNWTRFAVPMTYTVVRFNEPRQYVMQTLGGIVGAPVWE